MVTNPIRPKRDNFVFTVRILVIALLLALFLFLIVFSVSPTAIKFGDISIDTMNSKNMKGVVPENSLVVYNRNADVSNLQHGQIIVFKRLVGNKYETEVRFFDSYTTNVAGSKFLAVYDDTLTVEPYYIPESDFIGVLTKPIPAFGALLNLLSSNYGLLVVALMIFLLIFSPIIFAKVDNARLEDKRNRRALERQKKYEQKAAKKKEAPKLETLGITYYKTDTYKEAEQAKFEKNKCDASKLYPCPPSCQACRKNTPKTVPIIIAVLVLLFIAVFIFMMVFQLGATGLSALDFKTDAVPDAEANALVKYSEFSVSTIRNGDLILINLTNDKGITGTALRRFYSYSNANGKAEIMTYGADETVLDAVVLGVDDIVGVYKAHYNALGTVFTFFVSDIFFIIFALAIALLMLSILYYKYNNRVIYEKRLSKKAEKLVENNELSVVSVVSTGGKHFSFKALGSVVGVLAVAVIICAVLVYSFGVKFDPITASNSATDEGSYTLYYNNKAEYKPGDMVIVDENTEIAGESYTLRATRYIVSIDGDKYYLGLTPDIIDTSTKSYYEIGDFRGKQLFSIPRLAPIFDRLKQTDMIIVYVSIVLLIILVIAAASLYERKKSKEKGMNTKRLADTIAVDASVKNRKRINALPLLEHMTYCDDNVRASYNTIVNALLEYQGSSLTEYKEFDRIYVKKDHLISLNIIDDTLYAYIDYESERFPIDIDTTEVWEKKWKEPRTRVAIRNTDDARIVLNNVERELIKNKKKKKYEYVNFADEYLIKGVVNTEAILNVKTIK